MEAAWTRMVIGEEQKGGGIQNWKVMRKTGAKKCIFAIHLLRDAPGPREKCHFPYPAGVTVLVYVLAFCWHSCSQLCMSESRTEL
jgi:hypothetical protein